MEFRTSGVLSEKGVIVSEQSNIDALSSRGYGTLENKVFTLTFYESLYLLDKGMLEIKDEKGKNIDFQSLLHCYEAQNDNAWVNYLVYRDLEAAVMWSGKDSAAASTSAFTNEAPTAKTPHPT